VVSRWKLHRRTIVGSNCRIARYGLFRNSRWRFGGMAMKLFNKKPELTEDEVYAKLDKLMGKMASIDVYLEYLELREGM
jgi:hypothetical protein